VKILAAVSVFNVIVMGGGAWPAYQSVSPIPDEVVGSDVATIVTGDN
jgi:nitric oxide reductase subunit B